MQDTKNLKKKIHEYELMISAFRANGDNYSADYWTAQLGNVKSRISARDKNRARNAKRHRKVN